MGNTYGYLFSSLFISCISSVIVKWRISQFDFAGKSIAANLKQGFFILLDPFIFFCIFLTLIAGILWMLAISKLDLSIAYPFTLLSLFLIALMSFFFLGESFHFKKLLGYLIIFIGLFFLYLSDK